MTLSHAIDHLTYCSYRHNRRINPDVAPERWGRLFADWRELEARFQEEGGRMTPNGNRLYDADGRRVTVPE